MYPLRLPCDYETFRGSHGILDGARGESTQSERIQKSILSIHCERVMSLYLAQVTYVGAAVRKDWPRVNDPSDGAVRPHPPKVSLSLLYILSLHCVPTRPSSPYSPSVPLCVSVCIQLVQHARVRIPRLLLTPLRCETCISPRNTICSTVDTSVAPIQTSINLPEHSLQHF